MAKILKNTTLSDIELSNTGLTIPASSQIELTIDDYVLIAGPDSIIEVTILINSGDLVVNTGLVDLPSIEGLRYLQFPDEAINQHFRDDTERGNGITSKNTQEAVEESFSQASAAIYPISLIHNGTVGNGTYFSYSNLTPNTPIVIPVDSLFLGFTFSNSNSNADYTLEFRNNTDIGATFHTVSKVNTKFFVDILVSPESFTAGEFISIKYVDDGTNASDAVITLFFRATT